MKIIITFYTTYDNLKAEELLSNEQIPIRVKPVPRHISSDCGLAIEGNIEDKTKIEEVLQRNEIEYENVHIIK
ncbi:DUF3343 domain-containing protein [Alkalicella caledoniensis]|uniref:DUF3343 domain-containing protein n=1 Tax=Alkalicella caledoniensis TaxID=2731377 RepID=A0A7G9W8Y8_ALKCA|nr:DUF3343 domain-containing protein [Alkalicella caledoniensis]QNO15150.1 DUF3343 domain-containing protein [Alkalicella caledoniensis]